MITKTANAFLQKMADVGAITGAVRASNLTAAERKLLEKHYGLPDNANLGWRNAGRGFLGSAAGSIAGSVAGAGIGALAGNPHTGSQVGNLAGIIVGSKLSTDKYSKAGVRAIKEGR